MRLMVYTPLLTPRAQYVWEVLLHYVIRTDYILTADLTTYRQADGCKINYSKQRESTDEVFIPAGNLLFESDIRPQNPEIFTVEQLPAAFRQDALQSDFPFDLLGFVFYLISRYEEYLPYEPDAHGRFPARAGLAHRTGFLQQPLINQWACRLRELLIWRYPNAVFPNLKYRFQPTYDVDMAWAYRYKGWKRNLAAGLQELLLGKYADLMLRWRVITERAEDPFFTFPYLERLHQQHGLKPIFFFLLGDYNAFDKNISHQRSELKELIQSLHRDYFVGIHPSYGAHGKPPQIRREVQRLKNITNDPVVRSRQHFLLLRFPNTYRDLLSAGIIADYTMGYASETGFRASIASPYPWYDLEQEQATPLMIYPFQLMDVTLRHYLHLSPDEALIRAIQLIEVTKSVGGTFSTIWHNSSLSDLEGWLPWRRMYEQLLDRAVE